MRFWSWALIGLAVVLAGCGAREKSDSSTLRVAVIPKGTSHYFCMSVHAGAEKAAAELGDVEVVWKGPAKESDTLGQDELTKNMITQRVDAICLAPNHSQALLGAVERANQQNIPVVVFDSGHEELKEALAGVFAGLGDECRQVGQAAVLYRRGGAMGNEGVHWASIDES